MPTVTIHVRATRAEARQAALLLPQLLSGAKPDPTGEVQSLQLLAGTVALSLIKDAFVTKSRGGTDDAGLTWKPLTQAYVAYGRRHAGLRRKKPGERPRGLLTAAQDKRWRLLYAQQLRRLGFDKTHSPTKEAKGRAAAFAWSVLKSEGAKTIFDVYGNAQVEIGRDTGVLLNSLSPGVADNVLRADPGEVVIGTNVPYAPRFHALRPIWPPPATWPDAWWGLITSKVMEGAVRVVARLLGGSP